MSNWTSCITSNRLGVVVGVLAVTLCATGALAQEADHPSQKPMIVGSDFGVVPWISRGVSGAEGFGVDLAAELARRLKRPGYEIVDINVAGLFAALFSKRIEFTVSATGITAERAERILFTQPIFATGNGFLIRSGDSMASFEDLRGKSVAVNRGTISDNWVTANAEKYGFEIQRYDTFPDTVQAVITRRAFAAMNEIPNVVYVASQNKAVKVGVKDFTGRNFGLAFRPESREYRNKVDDLLTCMKMDGTLAKLHEKWYGVAPDKGSPTVTVYEGYGAPGFKGHEPTPHKPVCA
jgi:polar amino acid transport system substrate-binding protein